MKPWEESYQTHKWAVYKIPLKNKDVPPCGPDDSTGLKVCGSDSEMARDLKEDPNRFYFDWEQIFAGLSGISGMASLSRLTSDWKGHKTGALVYVVYEGIKEKPPCVTYLVEAQQ